MTRNDFNRHFAATGLNTEGYTTAQLDEINNWVFAAVACGLNLGDDNVKSTIDHGFETAFANADRIGEAETND